MRYEEFDPHPELAHHVLAYWAFEVAADREAPYLHHVMPDGCVSLVYARGAARHGLMIVGPRLEGLQVAVEGGDVFWGVRCWPGAAGPLLSVAPHALYERVDPLAHHLPDLSGHLSGRLDACTSSYEAAAVWDASLRPLAEAAAPSDAVVREAVEAMVRAAGQEAVGALAERLALSERQFQRRFREAVGLTPKQFARIRRFRASAANILEEEPEAWGTVAAEQGYADQPHLNREFSQLVGLPPTGFHERVRAITHGDVLPYSRGQAGGRSKEEGKSAKGKGPS